MRTSVAAAYNRMDELDKAGEAYQLQVHLRGGAKPITGDMKQRNAGCLVIEHSVTRRTYIATEDVAAITIEEI